MKLSIPSATITVNALDIDLDPADLSDDSLAACVAIAVDRGMISGHAANLRIVIERAYASLLRNDPVVAIAQLATVLAPETEIRHLKQAVFEKKRTEEAA